MSTTSQPPKSRQEIQDELKDVFAAHLNLKQEDIKLDSKFEEDLGMDSLDSVELIMAVEDTFSLPEEISPDDAAKLNTFGELVDYLVSKLT